VCDFIQPSWSVTYLCLFSLDFFFHPQDRSKMFLRNVRLLPKYAALKTRRPFSSLSPCENVRVNISTFLITAPRPATATSWSTRGAGRVLSSTSFLHPEKLITRDPDSCADNDKFQFLRPTNDSIKRDAKVNGKILLIHTSTALSSFPTGLRNAPTFVCAFSLRFL
jgi:hypothetical protein